MFRGPRARWWTAGMVMVAAATLALLELVPVSSQALTVHIGRAPAAVPLDDPWDPIWDHAAAQEIALSAQQIALPFGGGSVPALTIRGFHDDERLYLLLEWADDEQDDSIGTVNDFADAVAVQFPSPGVDRMKVPFTMGAQGMPVNIWQWKALWQADIARGFTASAAAHPDTYVDTYPFGDETLFKPALHVGNPLSQRTHDSPVENLVAEGFGSLTTSELQDVAGAGEWREGRWRVLFARGLDAGAEGMASFSPDQPTGVAFAVWDGGEDERNGQKSIAPFVDLTLTNGTAPDSVAVGTGAGFGRAQISVLLVIGLSAAAGVLLFRFGTRRTTSS